MITFNNFCVTSNLTWSIRHAVIVIIIILILILSMVSPLTKMKNFNRFYLITHGLGSSIGTATGYRLDGPGIKSRWGARFSAPVQTGPGAHLASGTMGTGSLPGVKSSWGLTLTPRPLLVPWSWKSRVIPLLHLWAVRPVQSLSACTRVHFTFTFYLIIQPWRSQTTFQNIKGEWRSLLINVRASRWFVITAFWTSTNKR
jgi:hypothetical protein